MSYTHPTIEEREVIAKMLFAGDSKAEIAKELNRSPSTIGLELNRSLKKKPDPNGTVACCD